MTERQSGPFRDDYVPDEPPALATYKHDVTVPGGPSAFVPGLPVVGPAIGDELDAMARAYEALAALPEASRDRAVTWLRNVLNPRFG